MTQTHNKKTHEILFDISSMLLYITYFLFNKKNYIISKMLYLLKINK